MWVGYALLSQPTFAESLGGPAINKYVPVDRRRHNNDNTECTTTSWLCQLAHSALGRALPADMACQPGVGLAGL